MKFYVENINTIDGKRNGYFVTQSNSVVELLNSFEEDNYYPLNEAPRIWAITEEQAKNFPLSCPGNAPMVYDPEYGFLYQEADNNVFNAEFVVENAEGTRYAVFEGDWNGEYYEATECHADGTLIKENIVRLYPVDVEVEEDIWERAGYEVR